MMNTIMAVLIAFAAYHGGKTIDCSCNRSRAIIAMVVLIAGGWMIIDYGMKK